LTVIAVCPSVVAGLVTTVGSASAAHGVVVAKKRMGNQQEVG
jgi:hypothetical protein